MIELLNTYSAIWIAVGCGFFIGSMGVRLCIKTATSRGQMKRM